MRAPTLLLIALLLPPAAAGNEPLPADLPSAPGLCADDGEKPLRGGRARPRLKSINLGDAPAPPQPVENGAGQDADLEYDIEAEEDEEQDAPERSNARRPGTQVATGSLRERGRRVDARIAAGDSAGARALIDTMVADPALAGEPEAFRIAVLTTAGRLAAIEGDPGAAYDLLWAATRLPQAPWETWELFAHAGVLMERVDETALALAEMATRHPDRLPELNPDLLLQTIHQGAPDAPGRRRLLEALFAANYSPSAVGDASALSYQLALLQLGAGEDATAATARIHHPDTLLRMRMDRRFDAIVAADPARFDLERAAEAWESDLRAKALLEPHVLELQTELAGALLMQGAAETVVALGEGVGGSDDYVDGDRFLIWMHNAHATALARLGRGEEALALLRTAAAMPESGGGNVSLVLNLAQMHTRLRQPAQALAAVGTVGRMSGFGRMVLVDVQHRAASQQGNPTAAAAALAYLVEHRDDAPVIAIGALLEAGRIEDASAAAITALADAGQRDDVLHALQRFRDAPRLPGDPDADRDWEALRTRADVLAAVAEHGRILDVPLYRAW